jgi:PAS domain-containing protein
LKVLSYKGGDAMMEYKEVFDKFSVPTLIIDREYTIIDMNKSALSMFKSAAIEFNLTKCYEVSHASETPCWEEEYHTCPAKKAFESGQTTRAIHRHKTEPDETVHEVITTPVFGKDGVVLYVIEEYHSSVQEFRGLITICSYCKKIQMEDGRWKVVEDYINSHTIAELSHGCCSDCLKQVGK